MAVRRNANVVVVCLFIAILAMEGWLITTNKTTTVWQNLSDLAFIVATLTFLGFMYLEFRTKVCKRVIESHELYNDWGYNLQLGWHVFRKPQSLQHNGVAYEEAFDTLPKARVGILGDLYAV